ncbi:hypothetical protein [Lewinella sp. LCG006]|uniref:hypothetical protein n=1 Tax=Lewinella sp. LCG006 TaxID=3231911 RepID=UPI00345FBB11
MDFKNRLEDLRKDLLEATYLPKGLMLQRISTSLKKKSELLEIQLPVLWLEAMDTDDFEEIPTTKYGVGLVRSLLKSLEPTRKNFQRIVPSILELLFTFLVEDDLCNRQGQFHYYYDQQSRQVFAESEMGRVRPSTVNIERGKVRPAYISELIQEKVLASTEDERLL